MSSDELLVQCPVSIFIHIYVTKFRTKEEKKMGKNDSNCGPVAAILFCYHQAHHKLYALDIHH